MTRTRKTHQPKLPSGRHLQLLRAGGLRPDRTLAACRDCQVSCQSACKTSCTVGNQRCPK
ncbi:MAG: six-cysteine ranthipeptide SCIFF [Bacillota bacterium]|jgi:predicted ribosomally synthesized six-cysteine peptide SCIFF